VQNARLKYLEMLHGTVARMATNQISLRAWSVGIGTAVIAFAAAKDSIQKIALLAVFPAAAFWLLDSYYLALEWNFRALFATARSSTEGDPTFAMDVEWTMRDIFDAARRPSVWLIHGSVLLLALLVGATAYLG